MIQSQDPFSKLVFELSKLPGVGEKSATRLAYFIVKQDRTSSEQLAQAILGAKTSVRLCSECFTFTDADPCRICSNPSRDHGSICITEKPMDVHTIERTGVHRGVYHVLHGVLSPLDGIGPNELKIQELLARIEKSGETPIRELILALNPSVEGDATGLYLSKLVKPLGIRVTKLAHGIPVGGVLEYTDRETLSRALQNRLEV